MAKLPQFIVDYVMKSDNAQAQVKAQVDQVKSVIADEAVKITEEAIQEGKSQLLKSRKYGVTSSAGTQSLHAKQQDSGQDSNVLWGLFSNAPGSVQCANRIIEAVLGGGYIVEPDTSVNARSRTKTDLKILTNFFDSPNPDDTIETIVQAGLQNYLAYGNWFMEKVPTKGSQGTKSPKIAELYNLSTAEMKILVDPEKRKGGVLEKVGYKRETEGGNSIIYNLNEVIQIKRPSPTSGVYGKAVLETNQAILDLLVRAVRYNTSVLKNGGRPPIQIVLPDDTSEADAEAVSAFYETNFTGEGNAGKALVLFKGAEAKTLGILPQDMAYLELIMTGIKLIAGQYGVPLLMVGFPEGSNRAVASEARRSFYYTNIYPLRKLIAHKITKEIIQDGLGIQGWKFDFRSQGLEESESTRRDIMLAMTKGMMSWNEGRIRMGLLPLAEKWADDHYLLGTKNDSLTAIVDAIGKEPDVSAPDNSQIDAPREQGQGADEEPVGEAPAQGE